MICSLNHVFFGAHIRWVSEGVNASIDQLLMCESLHIGGSHSVNAELQLSLFRSSLSGHTIMPIGIMLAMVSCLL